MQQDKVDAPAALDRADHRREQAAVERFEEVARLERDDLVVKLVVEEE